jgi:signal peptidase I
MIKKTKNLLIIISLLLLFSVSVISITKQTETFKSPEINSPGDWIKENQINVFNDKVVIDINKATWAKFTNTNSMDPFIDEDSNAIEILPINGDEINIGDVISYQSKQGVIIHRVVSKNKDAEGIYYVVKGDNNSFSDKVKVRFSDVKGVVVAVIY